MADYKVNISELNKRIEIQNFTITTNENDFDEEEWTTFTTRWAKKVSLSGGEFWSAKAVNSEEVVKFIIRYSKNLDVLFSKNAKLKYRIKRKDIVYNLIFANNIREKNEWIELKCEEINE